MKRYSTFALVLMIMLLLSACGAQATPPPTINPLDIQNTMVAAAFTMVAETQSAVPTATPPPPTATITNTPPPLNTLPPLPSADVVVTPVPNDNSGGGDPCITKVLPASLEGVPVKIRINNTTKLPVTVSVNLHQATPQSVCGYRSYALEPGQFIVINDLVQGCYSLWAWNPDPETYFMVTNGTSCVDTSDTWTFDISTSSFKRRT